MRCETHDIMLSPDGKCLICQRGKVEIPKDESTPVGRALTNVVHLAVWAAVLAGGYFGWRAYTEKAKAQSAESRAAVQIRLFTKASCEQCDIMRGWLTAEGLTFEEVDVEIDTSPFDSLAATCTLRAAPVLDFDGECIGMPFDADKANEALNHAAAKVPKAAE